MVDENEYESQEHLINSKIPNKDDKEILKYEDIFDGNVKKKVEIARRFLKNMKFRDKLKT